MMMSDSIQRGQNLADRVREALSDGELRALDALFLLGCRRSERHLQTIRAFDWSRLPRSLEFGLADVASLNCDQVREAGRAFLRAAIDDMLETNGRSGSELEVLRAMRLRLDGIPAQQLGDHLEDEPLRRRDPKTYRNWIVAYGYAEIRAWARGGLHDAVAEPLPEFRPERSGSIAWLRWGFAAVGLLAIAGVLYFTLPSGDGGFAVSGGRDEILVPVDELGLSFRVRPGTDGAPRIGTTLPVSGLPNLGSAVMSGCFIPKHESLREWPDAYAPLDSVLVALGTGNSGLHSGHVALWDPVTDDLRWVYEFVQRPGAADMNPDLPADAGQEQYRVMALAHSSPYGSLGPDRLVAVFQQMFSPCFVVMLDLRTGKELSRYASYGTLDDPLVLDIDQDGDAEIALAGTDNACDAPTLTVLDPLMSDGAASSVGWNREGEGALWRVVLPDPRALFEEYFASYDIPYWSEGPPPRLHTHMRGLQGWDPRTGRLALSVGSSPARVVYEATLVRGRPDFSVPLIRLGDSAELVWRSMGLDPAADAPRLAARVVVVEKGEGVGCPEGMGKGGNE